MARFVRDVMTENPRTLERDATAVDAARAMRDEDIGAIVITDGDEVYGILTDRDIVVRGIVEGRSAEEIKVGDICTTDVTFLGPDDSIDDAIRQIRDKHIRRVPVVEDGRPVGILSIGDLALERDQESALAEISAAAPNN
jgi:CBS domain-containing protein